MAEQAHNSPETGQTPANSRRRRRRNRFEKYRLVITLICVAGVIVSLELASYAVIVAKGHQDRRGKYPYNRMISGYTVFKNVPGYNMGSSTLREEPGDPDVVLDQFGFLSETPIASEKPPNTVRIFILGGSAAFGAGQNVNYHGVHFYPDGVHSYPRNIAGQLRAYLSERHPDVNYEVINAAAYERRFHQSTLLYLETISRLSPDYVVNIEGWNDINSLISGNPYATAEQLLPALIRLKNKSESWLNRSNTLYVLSTAYDKYRVRASRKREVSTLDASVRSISKTEYERRKPTYLAGSHRFEQMLRHNIGILQADRTRLIFMLQPMLPRAGANKELSEIERKLLAHTVAGADDDSAYVLEYFLDDYFTEACRELVEGAGEIYIDGNHELTGVNAEVEFYTDYCHLTATGNGIVAEMIGKRILAAQNSPTVP